MSPVHTGGANPVGIGQLLDGFDSQLLPFAIPVPIKDWGVTRAAFAPVVAAGLSGMSLGSPCASHPGDRFRWRFAILGSVSALALDFVAIGRTAVLTAGLSAVVGAAVISAAGPGSYIDVLGFAMLGAALFLLLLRHHIPPAGVPDGVTAKRNRLA